MKNHFFGLIVLSTLIGCIEDLSTGLDVFSEGLAHCEREYGNGNPGYGSCVDRLNNLTEAIIEDSSTD